MINYKKQKYLYSLFHIIIKKKFILILEIISILFLFHFLKNEKSQFIFLNDKYNNKYTNRIPVFTFHRLVPEDVKKKMFPKYQWVGSISIFEKMIKYLFYKGYKTISTFELYKWFNKEIEFNKKTVLITLDDGNYEDYYLVYPIIKKYNFKATSFVVGRLIKNKTAPYSKYDTNYIGLDIINKVRKEYPDFEFQSHSFDLHRRNINLMSSEELENDISKMEKFGFKTMAYPYGVFNDKLKEIVKKKGYLISFRFGPPRYATRKDDRFAMSRIKINGEANLHFLKKWLKYI